MKRTLARLLLLPLLAAGCTFVPTSPGVPYAEVTVSVVDQEGAAVSGTRVEVWGGLERTTRRNVAETGDAGRVRFVLPPAVYQVYARPPAGYSHVAPLPETRAEVNTRDDPSPREVTLVLARTP